MLYSKKGPRDVLHIRELVGGQGRNIHCFYGCRKILLPVFSGVADYQNMVRIERYKECCSGKRVSRNDLFFL